MSALAFAPTCALAFAFAFAATRGATAPQEPATDAPKAAPRAAIPLVPLRPVESGRGARTLHAAWLREVVDLDAEGAAADYSAIAKDGAQPQLDRVVALARLLELQRIGVGLTLPTPDLSIVPEALREHFAMKPLADVDEKLQQARTEPERLELQQLRPLVWQVLLHERDRTRNRLPTTGRGRIDRAGLLAWIRANDVARAELDGRAEEAAEGRRRNFPNWKPPSWPGDAATVWPRVLTALERWTQERELQSSQRALLIRLRERLVEAAGVDPQRALEILDRLPQFADRLRADLGS